MAQHATRGAARGLVSVAQRRGVVQRTRVNVARVHLLAAPAVCGSQDRAYGSVARVSACCAPRWGARPAGTGACDMSSGRRYGRPCTCTGCTGLRSFGVPAVGAARFCSSAASALAAAPTQAAPDTADGGVSARGDNTKLGKLCRGDDFDEAFRYFCELVNQQAANSVSFMLMIGMLSRIQPAKPAVLRALYTSAADADATLDLPSYNAVLESLTETAAEPAISAQDFGVAVFKDLVARGIGPDARTYGLLIELCVRASNTNGALRYLRRMRETGHIVTPAMYEVVVRLLNEADTEEMLSHSFGGKQVRKAMGPHQQVLPTDGGVFVDAPFWEVRGDEDTGAADEPEAEDAQVVDAGQAEADELRAGQGDGHASTDAGAEAETDADEQGLAVEPSTLARALVTGVEPELLQYLYDAVEEDLQMPSDVVGHAVASGLGLRSHEEDELLEFLTVADTDLESDPDGSDSD